MERRGVGTTAAIAAAGALLCAPRAARKRLTSLDAALRFAGAGSDEHWTIQRARCFDASVIPYAQFIRRHRQFFVFGRDEHRNRPAPRLMSGGAEALPIVRERAAAGCIESACPPRPKRE